MIQESQIKTYLVLLEDSLSKKNKLLDQLIELTKEQDVLFNEDDFEEQKFNRIIEEKELCLNSLKKIDDGFEQIYQRVKDELSNKVSVYKDNITRLKGLIIEITEKGVNLQALESLNKKKLEMFLLTKRKAIKNVKVSSQSVSNYYKNMANQHQGQSYFLDKKN